MCEPFQPKWNQVMVAECLNSLKEGKQKFLKPKNYKFKVWKEVKAKEKSSSVGKAIQVREVTKKHASYKVIEVRHFHKNSWKAIKQGGKA